LDRVIARASSRWRLAPGEYDQLHHFVADDVWDAAPLEAELLVQADRPVGGKDAVLVIDDTALAYLILDVGWSFRLGIRENKRAHDFGGNYPNSPSYQLLQRIYDTSIAIRND
jgi:hypothetical protein